MQRNTVDWKSWFGYGWATPVKSRAWAVVASALFALSQVTGYRYFNGIKHTAWCRAVDGWR